MQNCHFITKNGFMDIYLSMLFLVDLFHPDNLILQFSFPCCNVWKFLIIADAFHCSGHGTMTAHQKIILVSLTNLCECCSCVYF